jgi:hypothetical protein
LRWRTQLQPTGYVRATAPNSVKGNNNPKQLSLSRSYQPKNGIDNYIIINGYRGSFPSPQQASGVFD